MESEVLDEVSIDEPMVFDYSTLASLLPEKALPWSRKRWMLVNSDEGKRLMPIDLTKYTGEKLREIRARKYNFHGELQR